ncbi:MAG: hypothetical protein H7A26_01705 [Spirochaetales bacterium]|nr:hypothetical protein [Spirochaetales bacterium]
MLRILSAALLSAAIIASIILPNPEDPYEIFRILLILVFFLAARKYFIKNIPSPTPSGAIVMAIGIFINGALYSFPLFTKAVRGMTVALFLLLCFIMYSYLQSAVKGNIREKHFSHPVAGFAVGTWIAGISVCSISIAQRIPEWLPVLRFLIAANLILWLVFVNTAVRHFSVLITKDQVGKVHGVLFLSTVATQSLVIAARVIFGPQKWYIAVAPWFLTLGIVFYIISFLLIVRRYIGQHLKINLDSNWFNTNCIIHGAMSITGLASAVSGIVKPDAILAIWIWVIFWFAVVEAVEIARAVTRVRNHGFQKGLLVYNPTQWSRNFTFGMLYAFTMNFRIDKTMAAGSALEGFRMLILSYFNWAVLFLLILEVLIFMSDRVIINSGHEQKNTAF